MKTVNISCAVTIDGGDSAHQKGLKCSAQLTLDNPDELTAQMEEFRKLVSRAIRGTVKSASYYSRFGWELTLADLTNKLRELSTEDEQAWGELCSEIVNETHAALRGNV